MASKEIRKRIREEVAANQERDDEVTRLLRKRIERGLARARERAQEERRESS